jgi:hypothetical protein
MLDRNQRAHTDRTGSPTQQVRSETGIGALAHPATETQDHI